MANIDWILPAVTGLVGALIGTYGGAYFLYKFKEQKIEKVRDIAIKALELIKGYAKEGKTYDMVTNDFNNKLTIADKRAILVALHKIGIPIEASTKQINISQVNFQAQVIDKDVVSGMISQVESGLCDHLFFNDIESYFSNNLRLNSVRAIGKKYVNVVLSQSTFNKDTNVISYPENWTDKLTVGETNVISVLHNQLCSSKYFNGNSIDQGAIQILIYEIEVGIWDNYLFWEYEAYSNVKTQKEMSQILIDQISSQSQINFPQNNSK
ncbi:MAG: hypothetical protein R3Y39_06710 [Rikenellaceae bacterium]